MKRLGSDLRQNGQDGIRCGRRRILYPPTIFSVSYGRASARAHFCCNIIQSDPTLCDQEMEHTMSCNPDSVISVSSKGRIPLGHPMLLGALDPIKNQSVWLSLTC